MTRATINGFPCIDSGPVRWPLRPGVDPVTAQFDMTPKDADAVLAQSRVVLTFGGERQQVTVDNLFVLSEVSSGNPAIRTVMLTDQRWFWRYPHIRRGYNIRRHIGVKRLTDPVTLEIQPVDDDVTFAPWSLFTPEDGDRKWVASEVLSDVLTSVIPDGFVIPGSGIFDEIPIEDLELDDSGDAAIKRVLDYLVGAEIAVGLDGQAQLYSRLSGGEGALASRIPDEIEDGGHLAFVSRRYVRPKSIRVLFTREHEIRFDFAEGESKTSTDPDPHPISERTIDNVLPVSDFELTLSSGKTVAQGTWITFVEALNAWADVPILGDLDFDKIQKAMVPFIDLWSGVRLAGMLEPPDEFIEWAGRVSAIQKHYRQTFQIRRKWMDRIRALRPYRVALLNAERGTRGPAVAYTDFAYLYSGRSLWAEERSGVKHNYVTNIRRYPLSGNITSADAPAPASVSILDADEGVLRLDFLGDAYGVYSQSFPSMIELEGGSVNAAGYPDETPNSRLRRARSGESIAFNAISQGGRRPKLTSSHKAAVILTAIAGAPNTNDQLFAIEVTPSDVKSILPPGIQSGIGDSLGPVMEIRIKPGIETARVAWLDSRSEDIERAFGVRPGAVPDLSDLIINLDGVSGEDIGGASLNAIAKAAAARVYGSMADRLEGGATFDLDPTISVDGWIQEVAHELTVNGETFTIATLPQGETAKMNLFGLMDNGTRAVILKLASAERG